MTAPRLSILIATLESREEMCARLIEKLQAQDKEGEVQILVSRDAGQASIGAKRNSLLKAAKGGHIVFFDDDDEPADDYVPSILKAIGQEVDCVGFLIDCYGYAQGRPNLLETAAVSKRYPKWTENVGGFRYVRHTHHLVPVKREHALAVGFDPTSKYGEDYAYSMGLKRSGLLKNEVFIDKVLYTIRHNPNKTFGE